MTAGLAAAPAPLPRRSLPGGGAGRWLIYALIAVVVAALAGAALDRWRPPAAITLEPASLSPGAGPASHAAAVARVDAVVEGARLRLAASPREWLREEALARALLARHRLTGGYDDLAEADRVLDAALARAPVPSGPMLSRAALSLLLHRLDEAGAALGRLERAAVPLPREERAEARVLRGDIALQRGQLDRAQALYDQAAALSPTPALDRRLSTLALRRGDIPAARDHLARALRAPRQPPAALADTALQQASLALASGDVAEADRWVAAARRWFPGGRMVEAYAAQARALAGDAPGAVRAYGALAERDGGPEMMDALALLLRLEGNGEASRRWAARSSALWAERVGRFPEAAAQHAAEHELAFGEPERAVALARIDVANRTDALGLAVLARAETLAGRPEAALHTLARAKDAGLHATGLSLARADALEALGRAEDAAAARDEALARNPRALDAAARLVWFGHD